MPKGIMTGQGTSPICKARSEKKISQQKLADLCGVDVNTVIKWDYGTMPNGANLIKLARILEVEPEDLLPLED